MAGVALISRPDIVRVPIPDLPPMPPGLIWCTARQNARIWRARRRHRQIAPAPRRKPEPKAQ